MQQDCFINDDTPIKHLCHRFSCAVHKLKFSFHPSQTEVRFAKVSFWKFFWICCTHDPLGYCLSGRSKTYHGHILKKIQQYQWIDLPEPLQQRNYGFLKLKILFNWVESIYCETIKSLVEPFKFNSIPVESR